VAVDLEWAWPIAGAENDEIIPGRIYQGEGKETQLKVGRVRKERGGVNRERERKRGKESYNKERKRMGKERKEKCTVERKIHNTRG